MKLKIVKLEIKDWDAVDDYPNGVMDTHYLINPDKDKLAELKHMIESRHDYMYDDNLTDEEIVDAEMFCDGIWGEIDKFIDENFVTLNIDEIYEIAY